MYEAFYGLHERPFDLAPNPRYLLLTPSHREALANIELGISSPNGITVVTGDAGTGKTTLVRAALTRQAESTGGEILWANLKNPTISPAEFLEFLANRFALSPAAATSKIRLLDELEGALVRGRRAVLIVDEAQSLPHALLEEIRLLANIESDTEKLLPVLLVGQPELADRLNEPALRQLKQRVALRCTVAPLSMSETASYVAGRITIAGGKPMDVFTREAVLAVHKHARGIPRTISVLCDNALMTGYAAEQKPITAKLIEAVGEDFDYQPPAPVVRASSQEPPRDRAATPAPAGEPGLAERFGRRLFGRTS